MLKKIIKELKDAENEAEKIIEDAKKEVQKMLQDEKNKQEELKNKTIDECIKNGLGKVENRMIKAQQKAEEIYENSKKEKGIIRKNIISKRDQAVGMILDHLVKKNGDISGK